jgi:uncharacterized membrane protein
MLEILPQNLFIKYIVLFGLLGVIDGIWLLLVAKKMYFTSLAHLMAKKVTYFPVILFYLLFPLGILIFVLEPALQDGSANLILGAVSRGCLFGFFVYSAYDLTNHATLKKWPVTVTIIDILWGTVLNGLVGGLAYWILH